MLTALFGVVQRDLLLALRNRADVLACVAFFVIVAMLVPLGLGPEQAILRAIGPGMLWIAALLASTLALGRLFTQDFSDGTLEQMLLSPEPLSVLVAGKIAAHWLVSGLPLILLSPLLALSFGLAPGQLPLLLASMLLGTPVLSLIGAVGAALTLGVRGGGVLVALLVLPLYVPVLIFGAGAVAAGNEAHTHLLLLGGLLAGSAALAPWATAAALRIALE